MEGLNESALAILIYVDEPSEALEVFAPPWLKLTAMAPDDGSPPVPEERMVVLRRASNSAVRIPEPLRYTEE